MVSQEDLDVFLARIRPHGTASATPLGGGPATAVAVGCLLVEAPSGPASPARQERAGHRHGE